MSDADQAREDAGARAERVRVDVSDEWMRLPSVRGVMVGLLRDDQGAVTSRIGLIVLAEAEAVPAVRQQLPDEVNGTPVQVVPGAPEPEGSVLPG